MGRHSKHDDEENGEEDDRKKKRHHRKHRSKDEGDGTEESGEKKHHKSKHHRSKHHKSKHRDEEDDEEVDGDEEVLHKPPPKAPGTPPLLNNAAITSQPSQPAPAPTGPQTGYNNQPPYGNQQQMPSYGNQQQMPPYGQQPPGGPPRPNYPPPQPGYPPPPSGQSNGQPGYPHPSGPPRPGGPGSGGPPPPFPPRPPPGYRGPWPPPPPPGYRGPWPPPPPPPNWRPGMAPAPVTNDPYPPRPAMQPPPHQMDMRPQYPPHPPSVQPVKPTPATPRDIRLEPGDVTVPSGGIGNQRSPAWNNFTPLPVLPDNDEDLIDYDEDDPNSKRRPPQQPFQQPMPNNQWRQPNQPSGMPMAYPPVGGKPGMAPSGMPAVKPKVQFDAVPVATTCPKCNQKILTDPQSKISGLAIGLGILLFFLFPPLFFVPCLMSSLRNINHVCPKCQALIATRKGACGG